MCKTMIFCLAYLKKAFIFAPAYGTLMGSKGRQAA